MTLNKDFIFKHIRETKYPLWALYILQNYRRVPIMFYAGDDFKDDETIDGKIEKSINRLANALNDFPADAVLSIELKNAKTANGSGIIGPFEFRNVTKEQAENTEPAQPSGFGFINPPAGWVSEQYLNGKLEELKAENKRELGELMLQQRTKEFEERMEREKKELAELRKELNDEKKKYDSNTGAAAETLAGAAKIIIGQLFPGLGIAQPQAAQLAGAQPNELPEAAQPTNDPKYKAVEDFAQFLYNHPGITPERLAELKKEVQNG